jgi:hypothetical protein
VPARALHQNSYSGGYICQCAICGSHIFIQR